VARLVSVQPPDENDPDLAALRNALEQTVAQGISQDLFAAFADALQAEAGLSIEQSMINAVQTQFP
jgi:peptidyl-prolyl cis-trans isomerase D